jgi:ATPases with chaperone activity, ATP-binding subunit
MEEALRRRVIGQDEAIVAVSNAVRRRAGGLQDPNRPIGSFLSWGHGRGQDRAHQGPGGLSLRRRDGHDPHRHVRIHGEAFGRTLIGAPPGYVGYEEGGSLTEAVRRRPYQVILFDEVEKAHPDVFNVLLQVLDDGRLTDGQGRPSISATRSSS